MGNKDPRINMVLNEYFIENNIDDIDSETRIFLNLRKEFLSDILELEDYLSNEIFSKIPIKFRNKKMRKIYDIHYKQDNDFDLSQFRIIGFTKIVTNSWKNFKIKNKNYKINKLTFFQFLSQFSFGFEKKDLIVQNNDFDLDEKLVLDILIELRNYLSHNFLTINYLELIEIISAKLKNKNKHKIKQIEKDLIKQNKIDSINENDKYNDFNAFLTKLNHKTPEQLAKEIDLFFEKFNLHKNDFENRFLEKQEIFLNKE